LSIAIEGKASTFHVHTVSQTKISGIHAIVIISQHCASSCSILWSHNVEKTLFTFHVLIFHSWSIIFTCVHGLTVHSYTRHIHKRPRKLSYQRFTICILKSFSGKLGASGTYFNIASKSGVISFFSSFKSAIAYHCFALAYIIGKSACSSVAQRRMNKSKSISITSFTLAVGLSILLITTIGLSQSSSDFFNTNFV
jgi:hypothetical protein